MNEADSIRKRVIHLNLARLRSNIANLIGIMNKPLHAILRDNALPFLPPQSLHRLRSVSTSWNAHISSPLFAHTHSHTHRSISGLFTATDSTPAFTPMDPTSHSLPQPTLSFLPYRRITVRSSSNGLLCCVSKNTYLICNPATCQWTPLPPPSLDHGSNPNLVLVFNPSVYNFRSDYSVVVAFEIGGGSGVYGFEAFSSATGEWVTSAEICLAEEIVTGSGISAGDVACWRTTMQTVVVYDPTADRARAVTWPMGYIENVVWELGAIGSELCCVAVTEGHMAMFRLMEGNVWGPVGLGLVLGESGWKWVKEGEVGGVFSGTPWPLRFQSGTLDVLMVVDERVVVLDMAGRRVRYKCYGGPLANSAELVAHINSLAPVYPQNQKRKKASSEEKEEETEYKKIGKKGTDNTR